MKAISPHTLPASLRPLIAQAQSWGVPGVAGLLCSIAALALLLWVVPAQQAAKESAEREVDRLSKNLRLALAVKAKEQGRQDARPPLQQFREAFPDDSTRQARLAALLDLAQAQGLQSQRTELRYALDSKLGLAQYRVSMPVSGNYAQLRRFIQLALQSDASLSLDSMRLRRARQALTEGDASLAAELNWTLHLRVPDAVLTTAADAPQERAL